MQLVPHPAFPPKAIQSVEVEADVRQGPSVLTWRVIGDVPLIPANAAPLRTDGLWQHTCFEMFVKPGDGERYFEFNLSPSTEWAAYRFDGYRAGMADQPLAVPTIEPIAGGIRAMLDLSGLPKGNWQLALTAVIEESDGTKSYWALAHPPGKPDFHDPVGFTLTLNV